MNAYVKLRSRCPPRGWRGCGLQPAARKRDGVGWYSLGHRPAICAAVARSKFPLGDARSRRVAGRGARGRAARCQASRRPVLVHDAVTGLAERPSRAPSIRVSFPRRVLPGSTSVVRICGHLKGVPRADGSIAVYAHKQPRYTNRALRRRPTDVAVGGRPAKLVVLTIHISARNMTNKLMTPTYASAGGMSRAPMIRSAMSTHHLPDWMTG